MRVIVGALTTLLIAAGPATPAQSPAVLVAPPASESCPVSLFAEQRGGLELRQTKDSSDTRTTQNLHLGLASTEEKNVAEASVAVHLFSSRARVLPTATVAQPDRTEIFHLRAVMATETLVQDVSVRGGYTAWVELTALRFADGSEWHRSRDARCATALNRAMLVGAIR